MNATKVKSIDDLPDLPFEQVLSYLSLKDRHKSRAVSRSWRDKIDSLRVKSLFISDRPIEFIRKRRLISRAFARNFISSSRYVLFFNVFGRSILSTLKQLRVCTLNFKEANDFKQLSPCDPHLVNGAAFFQMLNSFSQLEELDLIDIRGFSSLAIDLKLNLPMLTSIQLDSVGATEYFGKLIMDAPRLRKVEIFRCHYLSMTFVHNESIERLYLSSFRSITMKHLKSLKNLQYLYNVCASTPDPTLLSSLNKLKELHLMDPQHVEEFLEQKQRYGLEELKIFCCGYLLNGPDDPAIESVIVFKEFIILSAENSSRLADEIRFFDSLNYSPIERVDQEVAIDLVGRFTDLHEFNVDRPVRNIERFLGILKKFDKISNLAFSCEQEQDLFDRLPDYCAVQCLIIGHSPPVFAFLYRLNHLVRLHLDFSISAEVILKLWEELKFLCALKFKCCNKEARIEVDINSRWTHQNRFKVSFGPKPQHFTDVPDLQAAIHFILTQDLDSRS